MSIWGVALVVSTVGMCASAYRYGYTNQGKWLAVAWFVLTEALWISLFFRLQP